MKTIADLEFSDIFITDDPKTCWYKATSDSMRVELVPEECWSEIAALRSALELKAAKRSMFRVHWPDDASAGMRVEQIMTADSKALFVARRFRIVTGSLTDLGVPTIVAEGLMDPAMTKGLVLFLGKTGSGKSTTAAAFIRERLERFGGVCYTIENPIELPLQGMIGKGCCYQTEINDDRFFSERMVSILRGNPNIILFGEIRDGRAVKQAVDAANTGHLVIATFHAGDLITGLGRFLRLVDDEATTESLADVLKVAIHLGLYNKGAALPSMSLVNSGSMGTGSPPRILSVEPLWITGDDTTGIQSMIRSGKTHLLKSEVERQRRDLMSRVQKTGVRPGVVHVGGSG